MINQFAIPAFITGILGSLHCVGMCGPLALSLPLSNDTSFDKLYGAIIYNAGRIVTYSIFGLLMGLIGKSFALFGFQQYLSIAVGLLIIALVLLPRNKALSSGQMSIFFGKIRSYIARLFSVRKNSSLFLIGLLNGLLPCGLIYMALAAAIATGTVGGSITFMAFFGLGTLPAMWSVAFFGNYIGLSLRKYIRKAYPFIMVMMACLLILRGMGLGIQNVSPALAADKQTVKGCCHKP